MPIGPAQRLWTMVCLATAIGALTLTPLAAQQAVFRAGVLHVLLDVVVTDKDDRPVTDLTADDFEISEAGRPQTIADFERVIVPLGDRPIADLKAVPAPPPDTFSNAPPPHAARAFAFAMRVEDVGYIVQTKRVLTAFVQDLSPNDEVAVTYFGRSDLGQDFTHDPGLIMRAFDQMTTELGGAAPVPGQIPDWLKNVLHTLADARETRRALVLVCDNSSIHRPDPADPEGREMLEVLDLARRLGIPMYTIDPRGELAPDLALEGHLEDQTPKNRAEVNGDIKRGKDVLKEVAANTGGLAFTDNPDAPAAAKQLLADNGAYYLLGFYPSPYTSDGKFHDVNVKMKRPGLHVRARAGYTADKAPSAAAKAQPLVDTLGAGLAGGDLTLHAFAAPLVPSGGGAKTLVGLDVAYPATDDGAARRGEDQLQIAWLAIDPDARIVRRGGRTLHVPLADTGSGPFTLSVTDAIDLPRGKLELRVGVSSRLLGTRGSVHVPIDVIDFSPGGPHLDAAPLLVGINGSPDLRLVDLVPKQFAPFPPAATRAFAPDARLHVFDRVFATDPNGLTATLRLMHDGAQVRTGAVRLLAAPGVGHAFDAAATVDLTGLPPGAYDLYFTVKSPAGVTAERGVAFTIRER